MGSRALPRAGNPIFIQIWDYGGPTYPILAVIWGVHYGVMFFQYGVFSNMG